MSNTDIKILNYLNIDFDKFEYYHPHKTNYGSHIGTVSYRLTKNSVIPIYIETPKLITTSGLVKVDNKYYMDFEMDTVNESNKFYDFISRVDEKNIVVCNFNSREWFSRQIPYDIIEDYYKSPIKLQRGGKKPIMRVKVPSYRGKILAEIYNQKRKLIGLDHIDKNDEVVAILNFSGLRFLSQQFVAEWELCKLKLLKSTDKQVLPSGYLFSDSNSEEMEVAIENPNLKLSDNKINVDKIIEEIDACDPDIINESEDINEIISDSETPNLVEETHNLVEETPNLVEETPNLVEETPNLVEETPILVEENPNLVEENPNLVEENPNLVEETPNLVEENPNLVEENPNLVEENPNLVEETPNLVEETPNLVEENPNLVEETPNLVEENPNLVEENPKKLTFNNMQEEFFDSEFELDSEDELFNIEEVDFHQNNEEKLMADLDKSREEAEKKLEQARKEMMEYQELQKQKELELQKLQQEFDKTGKEVERFSR
jgi:hypothetical protein